MLRDYRIYRFEVVVNPTIIVRDYAGDEVARHKEVMKKEVNIIAPRFDGEEVARLFIKNNLYKFTEIQSVTLVDTLEINGATWMETA